MIKSIRKFFCAKPKPLSFAVVGSGPAGMYTSRHLLTKLSDVTVDIFDNMPHPFGLVRTGVAPDHQDTKKVMNNFTKVLEDPRVNFYGNITVGKDISFASLQDNYSGIILAYGADDENNLNIQNENTYGSFSARRFVNWYNAHVDYSNLEFPLDSEDCIVIGNGNVAIDVTRMLIKSYDDLKSYDIPEPVLAKLTKNKVKNIHMIGRRGLLQSAFTNPELNQIMKLKNVKLFVYEDELKDSMDEISMKVVTNSPNQADRNIANSKIRKFQGFNIVKDDDDLRRNLDPEKKNLIFRFFLAPSEISLNNGSVSNVKFLKTKLVETKSGSDSILTNQLAASINTQLLLKSIGYKSRKQFQEVDFSEKTNTINHVRGKVLDNEQNITKNIFTVGWVKIGAKGIIDSTLKDSNYTAESIFLSIQENQLIPKIPDRNGILEQARKINPNIINYQQWLKVNKYEIEEGVKLGRIREKILTRDKMINIALN